MTEVTTRRAGKILKTGDSLSITLTKEFEFFKLKSGDEVTISIVDKTIQISPVTIYEKYREEAAKK